MFCAEDLDRLTLRPVFFGECKEREAKQVCFNLNYVAGDRLAFWGVSVFRDWQSTGSHGKASVTSVRRNLSVLAFTLTIKPQINEFTAIASNGRVIISVGLVFIRRGYSRSYCANFDRSYFNNCAHLLN